MAKKGQKPWNYGTSKGWVDKRGYRWISIIENGNQRAIKEHRYIMQQHLGRKLEPEELVHHKNGIKDDNRMDNLSLSTFKEHAVDTHAGLIRSDLTKQRMQVLANYREEHKRLKEINAELLEACKEALNCMLVIQSFEDKKAPFESMIIQLQQAISKVEKI